MPASNSRDTIFRQWKLLQLVPREPQSISVGHIHRRLDSEGYSVTRRTVERDLSKLLSAGFPLFVDDSQEPYLWSWSKSAPTFTLPVPSVTDALLLTMVRDYLKPILPPNMLEALEPFLKRADDVLGKSAPKSKMARWREKVRVAHPWQPLIAPCIDSHTHAVVSECLLQENQFDADYASRSGGKSSQFRIHPRALLQRGPVVYLLGTCWDYADIRRFALHRLKNAVNTYTPITKLPDFDLDSYLAKGYADFGSGGVKTLDILVAPHVAEHLQECRLSKDQTLVPAESPAGWIRVRATVADTPQLEWWLKGFGDSVQR